MPPHSPPREAHDCPSRTELASLIRGDGTGDRQAELSDHVGDCPNCQLRMDALATNGDSNLSDVVRHIDQSRPASDSAFWRAIDQAEVAVTQAYASDPGLDTPSELKLDFLQTTTTADRIGALGRFEIVRVIGRGGMGVVLHAFDPSLSRDVAIKILDPQLASNDLAIQRFCREARAAAAVTHDNIVAVHQVNEDDKSGLPYLVMQLVSGESLEQRLRRVGRLTVPEAVRIGMQAAAGLAGAHASGLIHRDVKPGNILIEAATDKVKLTDFGLARATEDMKLTRTGFVAGTPLYMAPEQARGDDIDHRVDLFSLGSVLYESLAGRPPFDGKTPLAVLRRVADEAHTRLRRLNPTVPEWLEDAIDRLLEKNPDDRFGTAAEVSELFAHHLCHLSPMSPLEVRSAGACTMAGAGPKARRKFCIRTAVALGVVFLTGALLGAMGTLSFMTPPEINDLTLPALQNAAALNPALGTPVQLPGVAAGRLPNREFSSQSGGVWSTALSSDSSLLATGLENGRISVWDVQKQQLKYDLRHESAGKDTAHTGIVWTVEFMSTPNGEKLVSAGDDGMVKTWDVSKGKLDNSLELGRPIRAAAVSAPTNLIAIGDAEGKVQVFDLEHDSPIHTYLQSGAVNGVAFSSDGTAVASVASDGSIIVSDIPTNLRRYTLKGHTGPVYGVAFSADGDRLVTTGWDKSAIVWNLANGNQLKQLDGHDGGVWAARFTPCGRILATVGQDGKTRVWEADSGQLLETFGRHLGMIHTLRFDQTGATLVTGGRDGNVFVWDAGHCQKNDK